MANIRLFDGTTDTKYGLAVVPALAELAKHQRVTISPRPGGMDVNGYKFIKNLERISFNPSRNQCDIAAFTGEAMRCFDRAGFPVVETILITNKDFYGDGLNWCFGFSTGDSAGRQYTVLSTTRIATPELFTHVLTHELGHTYGAARPGRSNTEENLGSHCTNVCVMQQKLTIEAMMTYARFLQARKDKFCGQCADEIKSQR